jgi:hypothetical protein
VLEPLPSYGESYGDALAAPSPAADPLALPPLPPAEPPAAAGYAPPGTDPPAVQLPGLYAEPPGEAPPEEPLVRRSALGQSDHGQSDLDQSDLDLSDLDLSDLDQSDLSRSAAGRSDLGQPSQRRLPGQPQIRVPAEPPTGPPTIPALPAIRAGTDTASLRTAAIPQPVRGGRLAAGLPRGWDPPTVPANRGWSREVPPPPPPTRRRPRVAALPGAVPSAPTTAIRPASGAPATAARPAGPPGLVPRMPPELAEALARFQRGTTRQRVVRGRLGVMFLVGVLLAEAVANRSYGAVVVLGVVLVAVGLTFYRRGGRDRETRRAVPWPPPG